MLVDLKDYIGSKLVIGFPGTKITSAVLDQFKETHAGGVIFYRINFESPHQLRRLISRLEEALERRLLVCVDHEGGRVVMYREGVTIFPDNLAFGQAGKVEWAREAGQIAAKELRGLGTDVNFAPVLDVLTTSYSPNIGIRSYGQDWQQVSEMGAAYITALQAGGVSATAKHFPGKGHAPVDAHLKLPTIPSTWEEMKKVHLKPFERAIEAGVDVIMTSHPYYPRLDPNPENITTFSRRIVFDTLRDEMSYKGVISSDDLEMGAIRDVAPLDVAAVKTAAAGHDLILSCHDFGSQKKVFYGLLEAYKNHQLPKSELEASVDRIEKLKAKRKNQFEGEPKAQPKGRELALTVSKKAVRIFQDKNQILPLSAASKKEVAVVFPQLSSFSSKIMIEKEFEDETTILHRLLGPQAGSHVIEVYGIEPSEDDRDRCRLLARRTTATLFFCFDAHLFPSQQELLKDLQENSKKLVVIFLRDPYDKKFLRSQDAGLTAYGFRRCQIEALLSHIYGEN